MIPLRSVLLAHGLLLACGPKEIPPHLRMEPRLETQDQPTPARTLEEALARLVRGDPLARRVDPGPPGAWVSVPGGGPLVAWAAIAARPDANPADWTELETAWRGTVAVPLARGARLAAVEAAAAAPETPGEEGLSVLPWLGPVAVDAVVLPAGARAPLEWLGATPAAAHAAAVHLAERQVMLGWLDGPAIPAQVPASALTPGVHDRLLDSPVGALLQARAGGAVDDARAASGKDALVRATTLALQEAAADRDSEQEAWREQRRSAESELGGDPIPLLLARAREDLTADAADPSSTALGLVALTAERLQGSCPDRPCIGLDRVATLEVARRWDPAAEPTAAVWTVIALKRALDTLEVTHDRAGVPQAWVALADALVGTGGGSVRHAFLRTRSPSEATWLELSRLAGGADATTWEGAWQALNQRLIQVVDAAFAEEITAEQRRILERIRQRAARG